MAARTRPVPLSRPTGVFAPVCIDPSNRMAWWDVQRTDINQKLDASADPLHSHWIHKFHLEAGPTFLHGQITDSVAYANCYKVQFGFWGSMWCTSLVSTALQPMGVKEIGQLPVGCTVRVLWLKNENYGLILGVVPNPQTASDSAMADFISQQGRSGMLVDLAHNYPVTLDNASLITDWSAGRPIDATTEGEQGGITETGLLDFLDSFMAIQRVDEECGLWTFWTDQLTRLAGHNLQIWSAGSEREDLDDEGEFDKVEGHTPYYWEALGAFEFGLIVSKDIDPACWQKDPKYQGLSGVEPCDPQQTAFYRLRDFYGYWGQAHKRVLCLPPVKCQPSAVPMLASAPSTFAATESDACQIVCVPSSLNLLQQQLIYPGVFDENLALTGRWTVRSAHEIILSKQLTIPAPKQMMRPEDPRGDSTANYRAAGLQYFGTGPDHIVKGEIGISPFVFEDSTQIRAAGFLDTQAFAFNWIGQHPFYYHTQDWYLPNEGNLTYLAKDCQTVSFPPPFFDELRCHNLLQAPTAIPIKVDHRYGEVNYYPNHSYFGMLTDGGIVIGDGFGAEIKMANGNLYLTAPGDINLMPGRNMVTFAGYDVILRAKNSWDISATTGSGRLKARKNLWMVATGDCGGILIQSKAIGARGDFTKSGDQAELGGIVIKAEDSLITTCAADMCFNLSDRGDDHVLIFDTGWEGRVKFRSKYFERFLHTDGAAFDFWVGPQGPQDSGDVVDSAAEYWRDGVLLCAPLLVNDKIMSADCIVAFDNIVSAHGHVVTKDAKKYQGLVGAIKDTTDMDDTYDFIDGRCTSLPSIGKLELITLDQRQDEYSACDAEFSFRSVKEYRTDDYLLFEARWQQLARVGKATVSYWKEEEVSLTYPYPGKEILLGPSYRTLDPKLYDITKGAAVDRNAQYEDPAYNQATPELLNEKYTVII